MTEREETLNLASEETISAAMSFHATTASAKSSNLLQTLSSSYSTSKISQSDTNTATTIFYMHPQSSLFEKQNQQKSKWFSELLK